MCMMLTLFIIRPRLVSLWMCVVVGTKRRQLFLVSRDGREECLLGLLESEEPRAARGSDVDRRWGLLRLYLAFARYAPVNPEGDRSARLLEMQSTS